MADIPSVTPPQPLQPQPASLPHSHKEFFIIGSIFTVLMLLVASGILYFENYSAPVVQQTGEQIATNTSRGLDLAGRKALFASIYGLGYSTSNLETATVHARFLNLQEQKIFGADQATLTNPAVDFFEDKNFIYYHTQPLRCRDDYIFATATVSFFADKETNTTSVGEFPNGYGLIDDERVFFTDNSKLGDTCLPPEVDAKTFTYLGDRYGVDNMHVYYIPQWWTEGIISPTQASINDLIVRDADPATFEISSTTNSFDAQDKNHRYIMGKIVATTTVQIPEGADAATFIYDKESYFAKDAHHVWIEGEVPPVLMLIPGADPKTFIPLKWPYSKDATHAYCFDLTIESADNLTFKYLGRGNESLPPSDYGFAADKNTIFDCSKPVVGVSPASLQTN